MSKSVCFNFLVCKTLHYSRTKPLVKYLDSNLKKKFQNSDYFLISGFDNFDEVKTVKLSNTDDYHSCIDKTLRIFDLHKESNYDWYFIGDDDTFVNFNNLENLISALSLDKLEVFGYIDWAPTKRGNILHAHGGSGVLMNKKTFMSLSKFIIENNFSIQHDTFSDVSLALNILIYNEQNSDNIQFVKIDEMLSPHINFNSVDLSKIITIHTKDRLSYEFLETTIR